MGDEGAFIFLMGSWAEIKGSLSALLEQVLSEYGINIAFMVIGLILGWYLKILLADNKYHKLVDRLLSEKDQRIADLNTIVSEKLNQIVVNEESKSFFQRIITYFRKGGQNR